MNIDAVRGMVERRAEIKTAQSIKVGEYSKPSEHPRTLESGRGHLRGSRYRGKKK